MVLHKDDGLAFRDDVGHTLMTLVLTTAVLTVTMIRSGLITLVIIVSLLRWWT